MFRPRQPRRRAVALQRWVPRGLLVLGCLLLGLGAGYAGLINYLQWRESVSPSVTRVLVLKDGRRIPLVQPSPVGIGAAAPAAPADPSSAATSLPTATPTALPAGPAALAAGPTELPADPAASPAMRPGRPTLPPSLPAGRPATTGAVAGLPAPPPQRTPLPGPDPLGRTPPSVAVLPPERILIPRIGVDWPVVLSDSNDLPGFKGVGWMLGSAYPGVPGNTVLYGHLDGRYGTFGRLQELRPGDDFSVVTANRAYRYRVSGLRQVTPDDVSVLAPTDTATATLITCSGHWDAAAKMYDHRLIVSARFLRP